MIPTFDERDPEAGSFLPMANKDLIDTGTARGEVKPDF